MGVLLSHFLGGGWRDLDVRRDRAARLMLIADLHSVRRGGRLFMTRPWRKPDACPGLVEQ